MAHLQHNRKADIRCQHRCKISYKNPNSNTWQSILLLHQSTKTANLWQRNHTSQQPCQQDTCHVDLTMKTKLYMTLSPTEYVKNTEPALTPVIPPTKTVRQVNNSVINIQKNNKSTQTT